MLGNTYIRLVCVYKTGSLRKQQKPMLRENMRWMNEDVEVRGSF